MLGQFWNLACAFSRTKAQLCFVYLSYPQFSSSEEAGAVEELLQAYDDGNEDDARRVLSLPLIKYMDNAVRCVSKNVKVIQCFEQCCCFT